jgi:hypothetical protein
MSDVFTDLMLARAIEKLKEELAAEPGEPGPPGPPGEDGAAGPAGAAAAPGAELIPNLYALLNPGPVSNGSVGNPGDVNLVPTYLWKSFTFTDIWTYCSTAAAGSSLQLGYYTMAANGVMTLGGTFGTISTATIGDKILAGGWTLPAGVLWLAWLPLGGNPFMRCTNFTSLGIHGPLTYSGVASILQNDNKVMSGPTNQSSLPASFVPTTGVNNSNPALRFAAKRSAA